MKVLVIGGGGREHALAWKLAQSNRIEAVFVAPGNGGTAQAERIRNVDITDLLQLRDWAIQQKIGLTVVGPEGPLAAGVVDLFRERGLRIFGPTKAAARLESSADGLAAGKGVVVAQTLEQALAAIDQMLPEPAQEGAGIVVEQFLAGEEASFIVMCDGKNVQALATSQDHKRLHDGDQGPNTGGMGAYSPASVVTPAIHAKAMREIILPTIRGMEKDGIAYTGFLYAGLMIDALGQPRTLEFNCRLGDPETQPILMRLKSDLLELLVAATETGDDRKLDQIELQWDRRTALGVVLAAQDYPQQPRTGDRIRGLPPAAPDLMVFHAGTRREGDDFVTSGGRVMCVTALADNVRQAQQRVYGVVREIQFDGMQYRGDIGHRAV